MVVRESNLFIFDLSLAAIPGSANSLPDLSL
ncbi:hypothetical protein Avbf_14768 [Armadillidium vulgare]|nr:hypothetical protein Avbf_14768 [Armadillidium vulgare]